MRSRPPAVPRAVLRWLIPRHVRDDLCHELDREYVVRLRRARARGESGRQVRRWYWSQSARSVLPAIAMRYREACLPRFPARRFNVAIEEVAHDLRTAGRALVRARTFSVMTVLMLTIGIGASAAAFSVIDAVLLAPLPLHDPDRIVYVNGSGLASDNYHKYKDALPSLAILAVHGVADVDISSGERARRVQAMPVSGGFFETLGVTAAIGRVLGQADDIASATPASVVTHALAVREFGSADRALGAVLTIDEAPFTIVGVLPPGFNYRRHSRAEVWVPFAHSSHRGRSVLGRLRDGATIDAVHAEASVLTRRVAQAELGRPGEVSVQALPHAIVAFSRHGLYLLAAIVTIMLLVACANVAHLCTVRNLGRSREFSVRRALGATRWRLARQILAEGAVLSIVASMFGIVAAAWLMDLLIALQPTALPGADAVAIGPRTALFTISAAALSTMIFAVAPGLAASARPPGSRTPSAETRDGASVARHGALVLQIALSTGLLVATVLLLRTYFVLFPTNPGFEWRDRLTFRIELPEARYRDPAARQALFDDLIRDLAGLPGVESVSASSDLPMTEARLGVRQQRAPDRESIGEIVYLRSVSANYLTAMEMPIVAGRGFSSVDRIGAPPVAVVNEALARLLWRGENPVGRRFLMPTIVRSEVELEVVGVVRNAWIKPGRAEARPEVFVPFAQERSLDMAFVVQTKAPHRLTGQITSAVHRLDPLLPVLGPNRRSDGPRPFADIISDAMGPWRYMATLVAAFAILAVVLTTGGLYGTLMFEVTRRRQELGLRLALGATPQRLVRDVLLQAGSLSLAGIAAGIIGASWSTAALSVWLYEVEPLDPASFVTAALAVLLVATAASAAPAWRAARTSPAVAMQS